jgi:hypothetical protein
LQSLSNQRHDFNVGMGPDVGTVAGGNNFGTRVFWTAVVPDDDVRVDPAVGTAQMHVRNLAALDYPEDFGSGSLGPNWQTAYVPATVSFDVVWRHPVTRLVTVNDSTDQFAGTFAENQATVIWSAQSASGFRFDSLPGSRATSTPGTPDITTTYFFAQVGHERNGIFFSGAPGEKEPEAGGHGGSADAGPNRAAVLSLSALPTAGTRALGGGPWAGSSVKTTLDAGSLGGALVGSSPVPATTRLRDVGNQAFAEIGSHQSPSRSGWSPDLDLDANLLADLALVWQAR